MPLPFEIAQQNAAWDADAARVLILRAEGLTWRKIAERMGVSCTTVCRLAKPRVEIAPKKFSQHRWSRPRTQAESEVELFIHLVQSGQITVEEAEAEIGIEPERRRTLEAFAQESGGVTAKTIRDVLRLRDAVLREFRERKSPSIETAGAS